MRRRERHWALPLLLLLLGARLLSLGAYPLFDTTEARYGEIARKMVELDDWITPWFDWGVPFWGKPPLSFWLSAGSMRALGVGEFAARLPSFLLALGMLALVYDLMRTRRGSAAGLAACLVLASTGLFFVCAGAVLTDPALAFSATLAMAAFWRAAGPDRGGGGARAWGYAFFAAVALGFLAKGPVILLLVGIPLVSWCLLTGRWSAGLRLPWIGGTLLALAIALPWYLAAEARTPGFLDYFLLGENVLRFVDSTWDGDLYGHVHTAPRGVIWLWLLVTGLPWTPFLLVRAAGLRRAGGAPEGSPGGLRAIGREHEWRSYLVLWMLSPALLFSLAGSVLPTYLLPGMPAMALLVADLWSERGAPALRGRAALGPPIAAALIPVLSLAALGVIERVVSPERSQATLLATVNPDARPLRVAYWPRRPFSGQFYSAGRAVEVRDVDSLRRLLRDREVEYVATRARNALPEDLAAGLVEVARSGSRKTTILWEPAELPPASGARSGKGPSRSGEDLL